MSRASTTITIRSISLVDLLASLNFGKETSREDIHFLQKYANKMNCLQEKEGNVTINLCFNTKEELKKFNEKWQRL